MWTYDILMFGSAVILGWFTLLVIPRGLVDRSNEENLLGGFPLRDIIVDQIDMLL